MALRQIPTTRYMPNLREAGIDYLVGAAEAGGGLQVTRAMTLAGASPHTVTFASLVTQGGNPIKAPADVDYVPVIVGNSAARVDLTLRTRSAFTITGGAADDVVAFVIHGRFGTMKR